jgi:hypothetical protein
MSANATENASTNTTALLKAYEHYEIALQAGLDYPEMRKFYATFAGKLPTLSQNSESTSIVASPSATVDHEYSPTGAVDLISTENQTVVDTHTGIVSIANAAAEHHENSFTYRAVNRRARTNRWIVSSKGKYGKKVDEKDRAVGTSSGAGSSMKINSIGGNGGGGSGLMQHLFGATSTNEEEQDEHAHAISPFEQQLRVEEAKQEAEAKAEKAAKDAEAKINSEIKR